MDTPCPGLDLLEQYFLGSDLGARTDPVEGHLACCSRCVEALHALRTEDLLVSALRGQAGGRRLSNPVVEKLRVQLRQLPFASTNASRTTPTNALETTPPGSLSGFPSSGSSLGPPRVPGDLGSLDEYRLLAVLGRGGMGVVYQAVDEKLQRPIALKVMHPDLAANPSARDRFLREARTAASLTHEHVVAVYRVGEDRGVLFLAMPLLKGESLYDRLRRGTPSLGEALRIGRETAEGLAAAHALDLIHRDVKPANLFLEVTPTGQGMSASPFRVKILDFGLARPIEGDGQLTGPGMAIGTPAFMAPEQISGHAEKRSDLFSLGCVLYSMATGQPAFPGRTAAEIFPRVLLGQFLPVGQLAPSVPAPISNLIHNLLAVDPAKRPVSAAIVAAVLKTLEAQHADVSDSGSRETSSLTPVARPSPVIPRPFWRRPFIAASAAAVLLVSLAGLVFALRSGGKQGSSEDESGREREVAALDADRKDGDKPKPDGPDEEGKQKPDDKLKEKPAVPPGPRPPEPRPSGPAISQTALVSRPERVRGVAAWDIEINRDDWARLSGLTYAADGQLLLTQTPGGARYQFDFDRPTLTLLPRQVDRDDGFHWSPDRKTRARIARLVVELSDAEGKPGRTLKGPVEHPLVGITWSPDGRFLVGVERQDNVWVWEPGSGERHRIQVRVRSGDRINLRFDWARDSTALVILQGNEHFFLFDLQKHRVVKSYENRRTVPLEVRWAPDCKAVAITYANNGGPVTSILTLPEGKEAKYDYNHGLNTPVAWSPKGGLLAWPRAGQTVDLVEVNSWRVQARLDCGTPVHHVAFSPDGKTLAAFTEDKWLLFWDVEKAQLLSRMVLLPRGRWFAIGAEGHCRGADGVEKDIQLQYTVRPEGEKVAEFTPAAFAQRFGWKNEPERVRLRTP